MRMLLVISVAIVAVTLAGGPNLVPTATAGSSVVNVRCSYEGGQSGDLLATIVNNHGTGSFDDFVDTGGCILVSSSVNQAHCTYSVTRDPEGLGTSFDNSKFDSLTDKMSLNTNNLPIGASTQCGLREIPINQVIKAGLDPTNVGMRVSIADDVFGAGTVGGSVCAEADFFNNGVACERGEFHVPFCGGDSGRIEFVDLTQYDFFVVFTNGPGYQAEQGCDLTQALTATTGGVFDPAGSVFIRFGGT